MLIDIATARQCSQIFADSKYRVSSPDLQKEFRQWSKRNHPDKGGSTDLFSMVQKCIVDMTDNPVFRQYVRSKTGAILEGYNREIFIGYVLHFFNALFSTGNWIADLFVRTVFNQLVSYVVSAIVQYIIITIINQWKGQKSLVAAGEKAVANAESLRRRRRRSSSSFRTESLRNSKEGKQMIDLNTLKLILQYQEEIKKGIEIPEKVAGRITRSASGSVSRRRISSK